MSRSAVIRLVVAVVAAMSAAAALLACNLQAVSGRAVTPAITVMDLQQIHHFKLPSAAIITAAVALAAPINVLNEVSGHASAGVEIIKTCATLEECEREIAQLRAEIKNLAAENKDFAAEIKSLGAETKALKDSIAFGHGVNASAADITGAITPANNTKGRRLEVSVSRHTHPTQNAQHTPNTKASLTDNLCGP